MPELDQKIGEVAAAALAKYGPAALGRIASSTLPAFQETAFENERQRPTWVYTRGLAARPWWQKEQCGRLIPMITAFEEAAPQIRTELLGIDPSLMGVPYDHLSVDPELIRGWKNLFFFKDYKADHALLAKAPTIAKIAERFGPAQLDKFELFLSVLEPGTHIPAHFGGANVKLTLHLPLWIPAGDTALRVDGEARGWKDGEMMIFDDTFEHDAWNRTNQPRAVLLLKTYHPELTEEEIGVLEMFGPLNVQVYRGRLRDMGRGA
jgi:hypothetical protein